MIGFPTKSGRKTRSQEAKKLLQSARANMGLVGWLVGWLDSLSVDSDVIVAAAMERAMFFLLDIATYIFLMT